MRPALLFLTFTLLAACTPFPELDNSPTRAPANAPWPPLVPLDPLMAQAGTPDRAEAAAETLEARGAALRARAAAIRSAR